MRNALSLVPMAAQQMVGATIRTVFAQPDSQSAPQQWRRISEGLRSRFLKLTELMEEAEEDVLSYAAFPVEHWQKIWSNNPLENPHTQYGYNSLTWSSCFADRSGLVPPDPLLASVVTSGPAM